MTTGTTTGRFALGDLALQSGEVLPGASLSVENLRNAGA